MNGFTLIELLLVIAITTIIGGTTIPIGTGFITRGAVVSKTQELSSSLRNAQLNAVAGKQNTAWGVSTTAGKITLFSGDSYAGRDTALDETFDIPTSTTITNAEVVFAKVTGNASSPTTFTVAGTAANTRTITINEVGTVNVN